MKLCYSDNLDLRCAKNMSLYSLYLTQLRTADFLLKLLADQKKKKTVVKSIGVLIAFFALAICDDNTSFCSIPIYYNKHIFLKLLE